MSKLYRVILFILFAVTLVFSTQASAVANLGISPVTLQLSPANKDGVVTVINKGKEPVNLQLTAKTWDMDENGKFIENDTGDFVFYPKTLILKAQEEVSIRVGYMGEFPNTEKPYRLFITEIPVIKQPQAEKNKLNLGVVTSLNISMPVYIVPTNELSPPEVALGELRGENKKLRVGVKNLTAFHVDLQKVTVKLSKGTNTLVDKTVELKLQRILGEHQVFVDFPIDGKKLCQQADAVAVRIEAANLTPPYEAKIPLKTGCLQ